MEYDYLICPKCWDKLIEVKEEEDWQRKCSKCGTRFGFALHGKKIDDSTYHSIILEYREKLDDMRISSIRNKLKNVHLDADNLLRAISDGKQGDIIYEGDSFHTYLFAKVFSGYEPWIEFEIVPKFPYEIGEPDIFFCPECGEEADNRTEPFDDIKGWFIDGLFCRHCNKWILGPIAKRDTTVYKLVFPYKKIKSMSDSSIKRGIMNRLKKVPDKKIQGDQMIVHTNSERIIEIVQCLLTVDFAYDIEPPFPHKIE